jgi:hypothetical protein
MDKSPYELLMVLLAIAALCVSCVSLGLTIGASL